MAWSTRQLADLAGTTVKAVRHYHQIGLLELPARASNGYKQYEIAHLIRLLQIKRLSDLGVPLAQIGEMDTAGTEPAEAIRALDAELEATITRLQGIRSELADVLNGGAPLDLPSGFSSVAAGTSDADRALVMVTSRLYSDEAMQDMSKMMEHREPDDDEFDALPADADLATITELANRLAPSILRQEAAYPWIMNPALHSTRGEAFARNTVAQAVVQLYNPAQLQTLMLAERIAHPRDDEPVTDA